MEVYNALVLPIMLSIHYKIHLQRVSLVAIHRACVEAFLSSSCHLVRIAREGSATHGNILDGINTLNYGWSHRVQQPRVNHSSVKWVEGAWCRDGPIKNPIFVLRDHRTFHLSRLNMIIGPCKLKRNHDGLRELIGVKVIRILVRVNDGGVWRSPSYCVAGGGLVI